MNRQQWSQFDKQLIDLIREQYSKKGLSCDSWLKIGKILNVAPVKCKQRWKAIRDFYVKLQKKIRDGNINTDGGKYEDGSLSFIDSSIRSGSKQTRKTNVIDLGVQTSPLSSLKTEVIEIEDSQEKISSHSNVEAVAVAEKETLEVTNFVTQDMIESLLKMKNNEKTNCNTNALVVEAINKLSHNLVKNITHTLQESVHNVKRSLEPKSSHTTNVLSEELENSTIRKSTGEIESSSNTHVDEYNIIRLSRINNDNIDTSRFFREMGDYVANRFPTEKQIEIRLKIWSLVANAEKEMLQEDGL